MEDFRIIYRILKFLQQSMDFEDFDSEGFTAERFGTNPNRFQALLVQLQNAGYIEGLNIVRYIGETISLELTHGKLYKVLSVERGWYRIVDDTGEDYLYPAGNFEIIC